MRYNMSVFNMYYELIRTESQKLYCTVILICYLHRDSLKMYVFFLKIITVNALIADHPLFMHVLRQCRKLYLKLRTYVIKYLCIADHLAKITISHQGFIL